MTQLRTMSILTPQPHPRLPSPPSPSSVPSFNPNTNRPASPSTTVKSSRTRVAEQCVRWIRTVGHHVRRHTGVGIVCAVAYFDPGNWGVDLQAGSQYGYKLLFVVLLAGLLAVFLQVLASRLGCVTGLDLATHCRLLLHSRPTHTKLTRYTLLYPLYLLSEIAIIATDLAELLGSAIAIVMIFPKCPMWAGVVVTAVDVLFVLAMGNPLKGRPVRGFEGVIAALVLAVLTCICIVIARLNVDWPKVFDGYVPSSDIINKPGSLYVAVGIVGATIMPHSLFLGSALATQDRVSSPRSSTKKRIPGDDEDEFSDDEGGTGRRGKREEEPGWFETTMEDIRTMFRSTPGPSRLGTARTHKEWENRSLSAVRGHLYHGTVDVALSLLCFAVVINSLILILASAVFYYSNDESNSGGATQNPASLFDAYDLIGRIIGKAAAYLFAFALLAAGQSSSIIATVAGQAVSEGFLDWKVSPILRRLLTRLLSLIPSLVVALAVGRRGVDTLLVASQVVLSVVLPFVVAPLLYLTGSKGVMSVRSDEGDGDGGRGVGMDRVERGRDREEEGTPSLERSTSLASTSTSASASHPSSPHQPRSSSSSATPPSSAQSLPLPHFSPAPSPVPAPASAPAPAPAPLPRTSTPPESLSSSESLNSLESQPPKMVDFSNHWTMTLFGWAVWLVVMIANVYVLVRLGMDGVGAA